MVSPQAVAEMRQPAQPAVGYSRDTDVQLCVCMCTTGHQCARPGSGAGKVTELWHLCAQMPRTACSRDLLAGRAYTDAGLSHATVAARRRTSRPAPSPRASRLAAFPRSGCPKSGQHAKGPTPVPFGHGPTGKLFVAARSHRSQKSRPVEALVEEFASVGRLLSPNGPRIPTWGAGGLTVCLRKSASLAA